MVVEFESCLLELELRKRDRAGVCLFKESHVTSLWLSDLHQGKPRPVALSMACVLWGHCVPVKALGFLWLGFLKKFFHAFGSLFSFFFRECLGEWAFWVSAVSVTLPLFPQR
jgi:hypothetical protein